MFPAPFTYQRAGSVEEAVAMLGATPGAKALAGGHSLLPMLRLRLAAPPVLVDIGHIAALRGVAAGGDGLRIGALTTHAEIAASDLVRQRAPILAEAASGIGDPTVRNRGTIGGNVAHSDPASDLPTVLTALGATFQVTGAGGSRSIAADAFFTGLLDNALEEQDILTGVAVPAMPAGAGAAYAKFLHPASRYAVVGAAAIVTLSGGACTAATVVVGGAESTPTRAAAVEAALTGGPATADRIAAAAAALPADLRGDPMGDVFASEEYRRAMAVVYVRRAIEAAAARAG